MSAQLDMAVELFNNHKWAEAEAMFLTLEGQEDVASYLKKCRLFQKFALGATVPFGQTEGRPLHWRVVEARGNMRLLLCDGFAARHPYMDTYQDTFWSTSALRKWLNTDFLKTAFTPEEQRLLLNTRVETKASAKFFTNGGARTMDKIYIMDMDEIAQYLPSEEDRKLGSWWWLRTPGSSLLTTAIVYDDGSFYEGGVNVNAQGGGVRPAMWLLLRG